MSASTVAENTLDADGARQALSQLQDQLRGQPGLFPGLHTQQNAREVMALIADQNREAAVLDGQAAKELIASLKLSQAAELADAHAPQDESAVLPLIGEKTGLRPVS